MKKKSPPLPPKLSRKQMRIMKNETNRAILKAATQSAGSATPPGYSTPPPQTTTAAAPFGYQQTGAPNPIFQSGVKSGDVLGKQGGTLIGSDGQPIYTKQARLSIEAARERKALVTYALIGGGAVLLLIGYAALKKRGKV